MSDEKPLIWPLRPSHSAYVTHALCMAVSDLVNAEGANMSRRTNLKVCGLATAAELFSQEASRWYGTRMGEDHDLLEGLQERYLAEGGVGQDAS